MRLRNRLARLYRALSGESQKVYGEKSGVHPTLLAEHESGVTEPGPETLERLARGVDLTVEAGKEILRFADTLRQTRRRPGPGLEELSTGLTAILRLPTNAFSDCPFLSLLRKWKTGTARSNSGPASKTSQRTSSGLWSRPSGSTRTGRWRSSCARSQSGRHPAI